MAADSARRRLGLGFYNPFDFSTTVVPGLTPQEVRLAPVTKPADWTGDQGENKGVSLSPVVPSTPGPSDWISRGDPVRDGDYVTLQNRAWGGTTVESSIGNQEVEGAKKPSGRFYLREIRLDNDYTFVIRKIVFDKDKKCFVLPTLGVPDDRKVINKTDFVVFINSRSNDYVLGTRNPPHNGNNGDYRVSLIQFPLVTANDLLTDSLTNKLALIATAGFWRENRGVDFLNQSRCIWSFHSVGIDNDPAVRYGQGRMNIRNLWTAMREKETQIWELISPLGAVATVAYAIHSTANGGRNLTQAKGSDGRVVKLALHNKDTDDKALWQLNGWFGEFYPVQRVAMPRTPPPAPNPSEPVPEEGVSVPALPGASPDGSTGPPPGEVGPPGTTWDPATRTWRQTALETATQNDQDLFKWYDKLLMRLFGTTWDRMPFYFKILAVGLVSLILVISVDEVVKALLRR